jgi:hypothetical protein
MIQQTWQLNTRPCRRKEHFKTQKRSKVSDFGHARNADLNGADSVWVFMVHVMSTAFLFCDSTLTSRDRGVVRCAWKRRNPTDLNVSRASWTWHITVFKRGWGNEQNKTTFLIAIFAILPPSLLFRPIYAYLVQIINIPALTMKTYTG